MASDSDEKYSYNEDSFESALEESPVGENTRGSPYLCRSGRRESIYLAESSTSSEISSQRDESAVQSLSSSGTVSEVAEYSEEFESEELSESLTEPNLEFVKKMLEVLSVKRSGDRELVTKDKSPSDSYQETTHCLETLEFCEKKTRHLREYSCGYNAARHCNVKAKGSAKKVLGVQLSGNKATIERLKIENLLSKMEKAANAPHHNPSSCTSCREQRSKVAEIDFLKRKLEVVKRPAFEARMESHLYGRDGATLLAEILNSGPRASDPPEVIWDRLLKKQTKKSEILNPRPKPSDPP